MIKKSMVYIMSSHNTIPLELLYIVPTIHNSKHDGMCNWHLGHVMSFHVWRVLCTVYLSGSFGINTTLIPVTTV